jgi:acetyl-CoA carboxylase carboxyltransferase component
MTQGGARIQEGVASLGGYAEVFQRNVLARAWCRSSA